MNKLDFNNICRYPNIMVLGPNMSGKTALINKLSEHFNGEKYVYDGMNDDINKNIIRNIFWTRNGDVY